MRLRVPSTTQLMKPIVALRNLGLLGVLIRLISLDLSLPFTLIRRRKCPHGVELTVVSLWTTQGLGHRIGKVLGTSPHLRSIQSILRLIISTILGTTCLVLGSITSVKTSLMIWHRTAPGQAYWMFLTSDNERPSGLFFCLNT